MSYNGAIFQQDLKATMKALEKDDFENLNIFANRVMSNSHIFQDSGRMICGFLIKDLALTLLPLGQKKSTKTKSTTKALAIGFLKKIHDQPSDKIDTKNLWSEYHTFSNNTSSTLFTEYEEGSYSGKNPEFTHKAVNILLEKLEENKTKLFYPNCLLLKGILNEIARLYKVHGGDLYDVFAHALITSLDRCYEYIQMIITNGEFESEVKTRILPEIQRIIEIMKNIENNDGRWIPDVDEELFKLCSQWRNYFLLYMEHGQQAREKVVRIPEESRKKLTEAIARSLEEELPKKNK